MEKHIGVILKNFFRTFACIDKFSEMCKGYSMTVSSVIALCPIHECYKSMAIMWSLSAGSSRVALEFCLLFCPFSLH